jgi:CubicO group peptidase (beta-lactamase class C family)
MVKQVIAARLVVTLLTLALFTNALATSTHASAATKLARRAAQGTTDSAARIGRVENGLLPPNIIRGQPPSQMKILDRMKYYGTPGVSIAVINNYKIEWARGYGVREVGKNEVVTPDTLFQVASISKPVTAMAVLRLVQQGKLKLDEDVNKYLVSWKVPENEFTRDKKVTIRGILTHTAGFDVLFYEGVPAGEPLPTPLQVLNGEKPATNQPVQVVYTPGSKYVYSGSGFLILQQLLVDVTGKPFAQLMEELVFRPLVMKSSTFQQTLPPNLQQRAAAGNQRGEPIKGRWLIKSNMASGGLWSTASDISRFAVELQKARLGRSNKVLTKKMANLMLPSLESQISGGDGISVKVRGLGIGVAGQSQDLRFSHGGYTTGYRSEMIAFGNGQGVVILTNGSSQALLREILRSMAKEYGWGVPEYSPIERTVVSVEPRVLETYAGEYEFPEGRNPRISVVSVKDGKLYLDGAPLRAESETSFFGEGEATYIFVKDEQGRVREMIYDVGLFKLISKKIK